MNGRAWLKIDRRRPLRHAVEIRHDSFRDPAFIRLLRRHKVALVVADTVDWPCLMDVTADFVYCRLHGSEELYASGYDPPALDAVAARVAAWAASVRQSGPMLAIDGALHPRFLPDSDSYKIRNGVGVSADGTEAVFALSEAPVNFHTFARFFRDEMGLPNALYFDGTISRLFAPDLGRDDMGVAMGPMVGLVVPKG